MVTERNDIDLSNAPEYIVTEEIVAAFVEAVDNEAFVLADIADVMGRYSTFF